LKRLLKLAAFVWLMRWAAIEVASHVARIRARRRN
jgi:hypothetical protein